MRKLIIALSCIFCAFRLNAQVTEPQKQATSVKPTTIKQTRVIPSTKANMIRKDVVKLQSQVVQLKDSVSNVQKELDAAIDKMKSDLNNMSEMGESESLRLQMSMDRMSRLMTTISNLLKKMADTQNQIVQNLK